MQKPRPWFPFLVVLALAAFPPGAFTSSPATNVVLATMQQELHRATKSLAKTDPSPYYLSYAVTDTDETAVAASNGSVIYSASVDRRQADVMMHHFRPAPAE
jgi:TldD protein